MKTIRIIKAGKQIYADYDETTGNWTEMSSTPSSSVTETASTVTIAKKDYAAADTNVSVDTTYNQLVLTCDLEEIETLFDSPTDEENIYSPYKHAQKYATEYASFGEGSSAMNGFRDMVLNGKTSYDAGYVTDHYAHLCKSSVWKFSGDQYMRNDQNGQLDFLKLPLESQNFAFLCEFAHSEPKNTGQDNSPADKPDFQRYLVISVNGNYNDDENNHRPSDSQLQAAPVIAEYTGTMSGGFLSPTDYDTTHYLVLSGKIYLQSTEQRNVRNFITGTELGWQTIREEAEHGWWSGGMIPHIWHQTSRLDDDKNGDGAYYAVKYYDGYNVDTTPYERNSNVASLRPYNTSWKVRDENMKYGWSSNGDETDRLSKLPIIQCTLKIGDKYACELYNSDGSSYYVWRTLENCPYDTYNGVKERRNHIYIGPDPKIDDFFTGTEYDIANNVLPEYNIDGKGICIPISKSDGLSGQVSFTIDGVCNLTYEKICRRHPTFFRSTKWWSELKYVLAHIQNIFIKDFELEIHSDNGNFNATYEEKDLVYQTEELTTYVEKKDDIDFSLSTALTSAQCAEKGITNKPCLNHPYIGNNPLTGIVNTFTNFSGLPEEQYITDYWPLVNQPKQIFNSTVRTPGSWKTKYNVTGMTGMNYIQLGEEYDVWQNKKTITLRQI